MTTNPWLRAAWGYAALLALVAGACGGDDADPPDLERSQNDTGSQSARLCHEAAGGRVGSVANTDLDELSGAAASRIHDGLWAHNDKGDNARIFGVGLDGSDAGVWELSGIEAFDWEDIATGPGSDPDDSYVFVADIGDNRADRDTIAVHRFAEPVDWGDGGSVDEVDSFTLSYPDGPHDAESFLVDPLWGDRFIIVKADPSEKPPVYRAASPESPDSTIVLEQVAAVDRPVTGADVTGDGGLVALRTFGGVFIHPRSSVSTRT
jgi:hypothetical protein